MQRGAVVAARDRLTRELDGVDPESLYELLDVLGRGSFGSVHRARRRSTGELVAIKRIPLDEGDVEALEDLRREIGILRDCAHPNIVNYYGAYIKSDHLWVRHARRGRGRMRCVRCVRV